MKKYVITMFAAATVSLASCGVSQDQMMMMEDMEMMKSQLNEIQFQVNSNAAAAARAKDMANEAIIKASQRKSGKHMMHHKKMMK